jgi:hypothetical protein
LKKKKKNSKNFAKLLALLLASRRAMAYTPAVRIIPNVIAGERSSSSSRRQEKERPREPTPEEEK